MKQHKIGFGLAFGVALGIAAPALAQQAVQWRVADGGNGHWYRLIAGPYWWPEARAVAQNLGGDLASLETSAERLWCRSRFAGNVLLGGVQQQPASSPSANWYWLTGVAINAPLGCDDSPCSCCPGENGDQDYIHFGGGTVDVLGDVGGNPQQCPDLMPALVEWSADCNGDGIVDYGQTLTGSLPDYDGDNIPDCCEAGTPCTVGNYPVQWRVEEGGNGHWYQGVIVSSQGASWTTARAEAVTRGGDLMKVATVVQRGWIFERVVVRTELWSASAGPWVGGRQADGAIEPAGGWTWTDGTIVLPAVWSAGQPDNSLPCGGNNNRMGFWNAGAGVPRDLLEDSPDVAVVPCVGPRVSAVFEWSADCDADGVVDYGQILRGEVADVNGNGIPDACDCPADINQSGTIDAEDLAYVLFAWGMPGAKAGGADINGDATVDASDLSLVLGSWGPCPN